MHEGVAELQRMMTFLPGTAQGDGVDWAAAVAAWGPLPSDYRDFIDTFGAGDIDREISVVNPVGEGVSTFAGSNPGAARLQVLGSPFPAFPEPGGLLCWGAGDGGDLLFWRTNDPDPDRWTTVVWRRHVEPEWREYPCGMAELILRTARREWDECPFSSSSAWGMAPMLFLSERSMIQRYEANVDPWSGRPVRPGCFGPFE